MDRETSEELEGLREARAFAELLDKRVVTIGGGTGPYAVLSSLKRYPCSITAVVSMADSGGSSRRLMDEFGQLPLGDLRQALVALSSQDALWRDIFTYRFPKGRSPRAGHEAEDDPSSSHAQRLARQAGVSGHSLGNLIISALQDLNEDNLLTAIENTRGLSQPGPIAPITRVFLQEETPPCREALAAIRGADVILIGPGDLYTSIVPNLLVEGVAAAVRESPAKKIYICNLMTKHGETDGFRASDFVRQIHRYLGGPVDRVIAHDGSFPEELVDRYAEQEQHPVALDAEAVQRLVPDVSVDRLLAIHQDHLVRHDAERLVRAIFAPGMVQR
jgi:2-phospho-L-lactate transferase/gluconeogenesis factor (CofD/UPF0052 family)